MCIRDRTYSTLRKLHQFLKSSANFQDSLTYLIKVTMNLGFKLKKIRNDRSVLDERQEIRAKIIEYLRKIKQFRTEKRPILVIIYYLHYVTNNLVTVSYTHLTTSKRHSQPLQVCRWLHRA